MQIDAVVSTLNDTSGDLASNGLIWVSVQRAAEFSGYSPEYIRRLARQRLIPVKSSGAGRPGQYGLQALLAHRARQIVEDGQRTLMRNPPSDEPANADLPDVFFAQPRQLVTTPNSDSVTLPRVLPARFVITDQMSIILGCITPRTSVVTTSTEVKPEDVRSLLASPELRDQRLVPFFSTQAAANLVCTQLRIDLRHNARSPQLSAGDNVIVVDIKPGSYRATLRFYLIRLLI